MDYRDIVDAKRLESHVFELTACSSGSVGITRMSFTTESEAEKNWRRNECGGLAWLCAALKWTI